MIDIKQIREEPERFIKAAKDKHFDVDIDDLLLWDGQLRATKKDLQGIATGKNELGKLIAQLEPNERSIRLAELIETYKEALDGRNREVQAYNEIVDEEIEIDICKCSFKNFPDINPSQFELLKPMIKETQEELEEMM